MDQQEQIIDLERRIQDIETAISIDRFKAEQERTRRQQKKDQVAADRLTVLMKRDGDVVVLAEYIKDAVKFNQLVKKGIIEKIRGKWVVYPGIAEQNGYLVMEIK